MGSISPFNATPRRAYFFWICHRFCLVLFSVIHVTRLAPQTIGYRAIYRTTARIDYTPSTSLRPEQFKLYTKLRYMLALLLPLEGCPTILRFRKSSSSLFAILIPSRIAEIWCLEIESQIMKIAITFWTYLVYTITEHWCYKISMKLLI